MKQRLLSLVVYLCVGSWASPPAHAWSPTIADGEQRDRIELPRRISSPPSAVPQPPPLPAGADALSPMTLEVAMTWRGPNGQEGHTSQTVLRTVDHILLTTESGAKEWWFERNPVDNRRVSGYLVDHARRQILRHYDSDLRNRLRLRGWTDVLTMRFDPATLAMLRKTGERQTAGGATFEQHLAREDATQGVVEVWWSDTLLVPLRMSVREGDVVTTSTIERFDPGVQAEQLGDPRERFPQYEVLDVTDSLERTR